MTDGIDLPAWAAILTALFVVAGAGLTLIGSVGLLRLGHFYQRLHAPTLGTTLGTGAILIGSMIFFSAIGTRPILHEILIAVFVTVTTPVTFMLLVSATRRRGTDLSPPSPPENTRGIRPLKDPIP
jgi:multicomponent K+:H+ antiporter subunit G